MSKTETVAEHDIPVQHMSCTSERVFPVPQMNHNSRDGNLARVESPTESCDAGILLNPAHKNIAGRIDDVDSYIMAARESIVVADSNKPFGDEHLPYTGDEPAYGHDPINETPETTHAERPMSMLSKHEHSSSEDSSVRDHASIASMSSIQETSSNSHGSTPASTEASGTQALPSTQVEYPSVTELNENFCPPSPQAIDWSTMVATDPDINMTTPANGHTLDYVSSKSLHSKPDLVDVIPPTVRVSVIELLGVAESDNLFKKLQDQALERIELVADLFEAAQAFEDAYKLRRLVLLQAIHRYEQGRSSDNPWRSRVAHVMKDASTDKDSEEALQFYRKALNKDPSLNEQTSQIGMLQQSYVGSLYLKMPSYCVFYCRRALQRTKLHPTRFFQEKPQFTLATQLVAFASLRIMQKTSQGPTCVTASSSIAIDLEGMKSQLWLDRHISSWLLPIFEWCVDVLGKHELLQMLAAAPEELWGSSPCAQELERFEIMFVACYLWKQAQQNCRSSELDARTTRSKAVFGFAQVSGLSPGIILSVVARLLVSSPDRDQDPTSSKSNLERRLLLTASNFHSKHDLRDGKAFMAAYTATLRDRGTPFSTEMYGRLIEKAVRDFAEQTFNLELEVSDLGDPRLRQRHSTSSQALSLLPSMCSTPRSSTSSMYRIFRDTARRASVMVMSNSFRSSMSISSDNDNYSRWSSFDPRRYSKASTKSAGTVESITSSLHDLIMEDSNYF